MGNKTKPDGNHLILLARHFVCSTTIPTNHYYCAILCVVMSLFENNMHFGKESYIYKNKRQFSTLSTIRFITILSKVVTKH